MPTHIAVFLTSAAEKQLQSLPSPLEVDTATALRQGPVRLTKGGRTVGFAMSRVALEALEDALDLAEGRAALAEHRASGEAPIPLAVVKARLGL